MVSVIRGTLPAGAGAGYGYGAGAGCGAGYGDGAGDGDGAGYGYGAGAGAGDGDGAGYGEYWLRCIKTFLQRWTDSQVARLEHLRSLGAFICFWRSDKDGRACHGGTNQPVNVGMIEKAQGPLAICTENALHGTAIPPKFPGARLWVVALVGELQSQGNGEKYAALEREIIGEVLP